MAFSLETRQKSRDLFVEQGLSYEEVARQTGVSINNLKKWGSEEKWTKQRDEYQHEFSQFHAKVGKLKLQLVKEAIDTSDPQKIYALASLLRVSGNGAIAGGAQDKASLFIEFMGDLLEYLKEKDPDSLKYLQPHIASFAEEMKKGVSREA